MARHYRITRLFLALALIALAGCSVRDPAEPFDPSKSLPETGAQTRPLPQPLSPVATIAMPAPAASVPAAAVTPVDVAPAAPVALVPDTAAAPPSVEQRIARLEETVQAMKSGLDEITPAFATLKTHNERVGKLLEEMERDVAPRAAASAVPTPASTAAVKEKPAAAPAPVPEKKPAAISKPKPSTAAPSVTALRIGEHAGKTRLVFDMAGAAKPVVTHDIDNAEKLLLIDISRPWSGKASGAASGQSFVSAWTAQPNAAGGTTIAIQLRKAARVISQSQLGAEGGVPPRLVIDIGPAQ